jgi:hypothetical protein
MYTRWCGTIINTRNQSGSKPAINFLIAKGAFLHDTSWTPFYIWFTPERYSRVLS